MKRVIAQTIQRSTIAEFKEGYEGQVDLVDLEQDILSGLEDKVLDALGLWIEPSIQGDTGGVWIYRKDDDSTVVDGYDYATYVQEVCDLALEASSDDEFMDSFRSYIQNIVNTESSTSAKFVESRPAKVEMSKETRLALNKVHQYHTSLLESCTKLRHELKKSSGNEEALVELNELSSQVNTMFKTLQKLSNKLR